MQIKETKYPGNQDEVNKKNNIFIQASFSKMIEKSCKYILRLAHRQERQRSYRVRQERQRSFWGKTLTIDVIKFPDFHSTTRLIFFIFKSLKLRLIMHCSSN